MIWIATSLLSYVLYCTWCKNIILEWHNASGCPSLCIIFVSNISMFLALLIIVWFIVNINLLLLQWRNTVALCMFTYSCIRFSHLMIFELLLLTSLSFYLIFALHNGNDSITWMYETHIHPSCHLWSLYFTASTGTFWFPHTVYLMGALSFFSGAVR